MCVHFPMPAPSPIHAMGSELFHSPRFRPLSAYRDTCIAHRELEPLPENRERRRRVTRPICPANPGHDAGHFGSGRGNTIPAVWNLMTMSKCFDHEQTGQMCRDPQNRDGVVRHFLLSVTPG